VSLNLAAEYVHEAEPFRAGDILLVSAGDSVVQLRDVLVDEIGPGHEAGHFVHSLMTNCNLSRLVKTPD
jgi:hypothetical protein